MGGQATLPDSHWLHSKEMDYRSQSRLLKQHSPLQPEAGFPIFWEETLQEEKRKPKVKRLKIMFSYNISPIGDSLSLALVIWSSCWRQSQPEVALQSPSQPCPAYVPWFEMVLSSHSLKFSSRGILLRLGKLLCLKGLFLLLVKRGILLCQG